MAIRLHPTRGEPDTVGTVASHIDNSCQLLAQAPHVHTSATLWVLPVVKDCEAVA